MNCLEFRRAVLTDPGTRDPDLLAHSQGCEGCRAFMNSQGPINRALREAMKVPAPASLADRIIFEQAARPRFPTRWRRSAAAAATAAGVVLALAMFVYQPVSLAGEVAQHIENERLEHDPIDRSAAVQFPQLVAELGGTAREVPVLLQAAICQTANHRLGLHLVVAGPQGPVTIFILPHDAPRMRVPIRAGELHGWLIPQGHTGVAVLSATEVDPAVYVAMADRAIDWPAVSTRRAT